MAALSGLHVACFRGGSFSVINQPMPVAGKAIWSQTFTSGGTTGEAAPDFGPNKGDQPIFRVVASANAWVAIGAAPDASATTSTSGNNARHFIIASTIYDFAASAGDKLAWILDA